MNDLKADLDGYQIYAWSQVEQLVALYVGGASRERLDPLLDVCVPLYLELDEDGQVDFKGKAKGFVRTYSFLAAILPIANAEWEMLSTFLNFLIPKLPAPVEEDLSKGILEAIDMESYRVEVKSTIAIALADEDGELEPVPTGGGGFLPEPELDRLSNIIRAFNDLFGNVSWSDRDKIARVIAEEIPPKVAANQKYRNAMRFSDKQNARIEHDQVLQKVLVDLMSVQIELFKEYQDNPSFKKWLEDTVFAETYVQGGND